MRFLQSLFLVLVLAVCYLVFFRSQPGPEAPGQAGAAATQTEPLSRTETPFPAAQPRTQYKADLDRAHAVANQMKASHREADSF